MEATYPLCHKEPGVFIAKMEEILWLLLQSTGTDLVKHLPSLLSFIYPMLVTLRVDGIKLGVNIGLSDEQDEVILGDSPAIALSDVLDGLQVVRADLNVVVPAELQVLRDAEDSGVGGVGFLKYF